MISALLLAGGKGTRLSLEGPPKTFRILGNKPLALHAFEVFAAMSEIKEIIVVCPPTYCSIFRSISKPCRFALPGKRRQDSVKHALNEVSKESKKVCIHDAARPFITKELVLHLFHEAKSSPAAALACPVTNTIKSTHQTGHVHSTLSRDCLWEVQTPQLIETSLLKKAFLHSEILSFSDDLSVVEQLGISPLLIASTPQNFKVTTPFDWTLAELLCE